MSCSNLVLGTAQLGLPYGIANQTGQPNQNVATAIVREAWAHGIREFDTAQGYGTSEEALGKALSELGISNEARIITKFDPRLDHLNARAMLRAIDWSLKLLGTSRLFGVMLHREEMLSLWDNGLAEVIHRVVSSGKVKRIGVSVYEPDKAIKALNSDGIDMIQLPTNILDRRFEEAGVFKLADQKEKTIYIRSVFLQGLILMDSREIPPKMHFAKEAVEKIESLSDSVGLSRQELALGYVKSKMPNAHIIFGAEIPSQVSENVLAWQKRMPVIPINQVRTITRNVDKRILSPTLWGR